MSKEKSGKKKKFIHRDLSWLAFNARVLDEAQNSANPLLERIRFIAICANNLDEFLMVRMASAKRLVDGHYNEKDSFGWLPQDLLDALKSQISTSRQTMDAVFSDNLKLLSESQIYLRLYEDLTAEQKTYAQRYFDSTVYPVVTPMAVDQGRPFPVLPSKTMAFMVRLQREGSEYYAVMPVPRILPRLLKLPSEENEVNFILLEELVRYHLSAFYTGYAIEEVALFRVMRDSELDLDEEVSPDLLRTIEKEVRTRPQARLVLLAVEHSVSPPMRELLCQYLTFPVAEVTAIHGIMDLTFLFELVSQVKWPALCYTPFVPAELDYDDIFSQIKNEDLLLHFPFQSFAPVVDFIFSAAQDPSVLAIKMTIYRTDRDSAIIRALKDAAAAGKQVTVLLELKARFDEEANIRWTKDLELAGCHVVYGFAGMKVHAKVALVIRKEEGRIRRYVHLSTGNYNEKTASLYTDMCYFSANDDIGKDISDLFNVITGYSVPTEWSRVISSPYNLKQYFFDLIDNEIQCQKTHNNGFIFAKMNSLEDVEIIEKLYEASQAGVKVRLLVRGICSLIPGVKGLSDNIKVKSVIGRFLEHSRIFLFNNNTDYRVFLSSADWMTRNLDRRIEILFEIAKQSMKAHIHEVLTEYWKNNLKTWRLNNTGDYHRAEKNVTHINIHDFFLEHYRE